VRRVAASTNAPNTFYRVPDADKNRVRPKEPKEDGRPQAAHFQDIRQTAATPAALVVRSIVVLRLSPEFVPSNWPAVAIEAV